MNLNAFMDISNVRLLSVQSMIAMNELIIRERTASRFDGERAVDHSMSAAPMTGRSLVSGSGVKRERSEIAQRRRRRA
jgi:hypothetical protein